MKAILSTLLYTTHCNYFLNKESLTLRDTQYLEIFADETMCLLQKNLIKTKLNDDIDETRFFFFFGCAAHHVGS